MEGFECFICGCMAIVLTIFTGYYSYLQTPAKETEKVDIVSLDVVNGMTGHFALGSGNIDNKEYFVCFDILSDGAKQLIKVPAEDSILCQLPHG